MYNRLISLDKNIDRSVFLWGQRKTGKSTLVSQIFAGARYIDLLETDLFQHFLKEPSSLREQLSTIEPGSIVVIDEIQKIPLLLDEIHLLIERQNLRFVLLGSSARKVKRGHANLLGGRALRYELYGLSIKEIGQGLDFIRLINQGFLPEHYDCDPRIFPRLIQSYIGDYLKDEIAAEGVVRNLQGFAQFLDLAALSDTEQISYSTFARDTGMNVKTVKEYFQILLDTLVAFELPAYQVRPKRRATKKSKFYFSDLGIVNHLAKRGKLEPGTELFGKAFESWLAHELKLYLQYTDNFSSLSFWRLPSGIEVDFILGQAKIAVEAKASKKIVQNHLKGLREFRKEFCDVERLIIVCMETTKRQTDDGIEIVPYTQFIDDLWQGEVIGT